MNSVNMLADLPMVGERINSLDCQTLAARETPKGARLQGEHGHDGENAQHSDNLLFFLALDGGEEEDDDGEDSLKECGW